MYNDDQSRQPVGSNQGSSFVPRRPISNNRYAGGGEKPSYHQQNSGGYQSQPSYERGGYGGGQTRHYGGGQRRHEGGGYGGGGYNNSGGGYRSGGYNRGGGGQQQGGASFDRVVRQNDIIIKLLKDIRERLPAPQGGAQYEAPDQQYDSGSNYSESAGMGDAEDSAYEATDNQGGESGEANGYDQGGQAEAAAEPADNYQEQPPVQEQNADDDESRFNS